MRYDIQQQLVSNLIADYGMILRGEWLQQGKCPCCEKKELFTHVKHPWILRCGRKNKCGWENRTISLYPDIFNNFNKRFTVTTSQPNATADAYLQYARGFDIKCIKGWYSQGYFSHPQGNHTTATVRFDIDGNKFIYMERLIEEVTITTEDGQQQVRKAHFHGSHRGLWWQPPDLQINHGDTIWLVEGCFDAIALCLNGQKAVATLSCVNYPKHMLELYQDKQITWVWALDNDKAGRDYLIKWVTCMRQDGFIVKAAQIPNYNNTELDWNDCHLRQRLSKADLNNYLYHGDLLIAQSAREKSLLMWKQNQLMQFCFDWNNCLYWFEIDLNKLAKMMERLREQNNELTDKQITQKAIEHVSTLTEIANCKPVFLYFQANSVTDESWYYCKIFLSGSNKQIKTTFTGTQIASATEFKRRLLSVVPGGLFTGSSIQLNWLIKNNMQQIHVVNTIDFIGYSKEHSAYIFNQMAISRGNIYPINEDDFFEIDNLAIKSLHSGFQLQIGQAQDYQPSWVQWIYDSFGSKGLVTVSFWLGCLFAEQIRKIHKSFPFLEIVGEPGAGKTTLIEFMWKLLGRADEEGFDPSKATAAAISRKFSQVSNLPVVLIEAEREDDINKLRSFDWDELKTAYNGRASRARGFKNMHNDTYEPPFRGAIVISQNTPINGSEAILQRIVQLYFDKEQHNLTSKAATDKMNTTPVSQLSYFIQKALVNEEMIMNCVANNTPNYELELLSQPYVYSVRIAKNHAQIMALADAFAKLVGLTTEQYQAIHDYIRQLANQRQQSVCTDHPVIQQFWEIYDYLNTQYDTPLLNHSRNEQLIAINLNHFFRVAAEHKQQIPKLDDLKKHLRNSKIRKFQAIKTVNSAIYLNKNGSKTKTIKCWLFEKEKIN